MKWTIGRKIGGGFALAMAALLIIGGVSYYSTATLVHFLSLRTHSLQVLVNLRHLIAVLKDAETGQRGFLITGEDRYLKSLNTALGQTDPILKDLANLTRDNPAQQKRLDALEPLIRDKLAELNEVIGLRRN